jgi:hypothetical protein
VQQGLSVGVRNTSFINLIGWTLSFCVLFTTHSSTEMDYFTLIKLNLPIIDLPLLLPIFSSLPQLHQHRPNNQGNNSWQLVAKSVIFSLSLYTWQAFLGRQLSRTIQDYGCVCISSALVPNAPSEITIGHYIIDDCFSCRKPNHKRCKCKKRQSLGNLT